MFEPKKVLHIISNLGDGGAESALYRLSTSDSTHQHYVISMMDLGKYGGPLKQKGVQVFTLGMQKGRISASGITRLWRLCRRIKPDVVQTWMYHADLVGGVVARAAGIRKIVWGIHHSNLSVGTVKRSTILVAKASALLSSRIPTQIVSCSNRGVEVHKDLGYSASKFRVVPNGYDLSNFSPQQSKSTVLREELGLPLLLPIIGMVARYDPQKDHKNLLRALALLQKTNPDFICILVGQGIDANNHELVNLINLHNLTNNVILLGPRSDIPTIMTMLDIHVLSSLGEAFPNVLAEAMGCATPCVTTDVGDASYIVGDTGWVVPAGNSHELAHAIKEALEEFEHSKTWQQRQHRARERVFQNFDLEIMISGYSRVWHE